MHHLRIFKLAMLWVATPTAVILLAYGALIFWPAPLFAYSLTVGKLTVASDRPIDSAGGERMLKQCAALLERSPLTATGERYRLYVTNAEWRRRLFFAPAPTAWGVAYANPLGGNAFLSGADFETGRVVHIRYIGTPPRTLAWLCAHELTHIIAGEHVGIDRFRVPEWVWEGLADYVGIEPRQSFKDLAHALGERPVDVAMMIKYGSYPRYRLLVTYFLDEQHWSIEQLLRTRMSYDEATALMQSKH